MQIDTGLSPTGHFLLTALVELFGRLQQSTNNKINSAQDAFEFFREMRQVSREQVQVACLNAENVVFYHETVALGGESRTACPLISIFHTPLRLYSQRIIIAHNHPRGNANPSPEDIRWQERLGRMAAGLEIEIIDHVIIGVKNCYSFNDGGKYHC